MADATIDITGDVCPLTFVKVKLKLENISPGQTLHIRLCGDEPRRNLPITLREEGYQVTEPRPDNNGCFLMAATKPDR
ncbi:MAG: sulfurtransferase TusA family protein [Magnetococcales bacterium]|nr:sulfurtransferase TusA family protein [Magnetococcales bacterium]MBF0321669.1 sulfurtransferase TusA family protein [Magnetococcales bacterium]